MSLTTSTPLPEPLNCCARYLPKAGWLASKPPFFLPLSASCRQAGYAIHPRRILSREGRHPKPASNKHTIMCCWIRSMAPSSNCWQHLVTTLQLAYPHRSAVLCKVCRRALAKGRERPDEDDRGFKSGANRADWAHSVTTCSPSRRGDTH